VDQDLHWLRRQPDCDANAAVGGLAKDQELRDAVGSRWAELPPGLVEFFGSGELQGKVPSVTGCWVNLGDGYMEPVNEGFDMLLRVISDQQDCLHWFVRLRDEGHDVVVSEFPYCEDRSDWLSDQEGRFDRTIDVCAETFNQFLWRFWIENTIYLTLQRGERLTGEQTKYVEFYRASPTAR